MVTTEKTVPATMIESLVLSLRAASRHGPGEVSPAAILWTDADGQWQPLIPQLRALMPELLVLGPYLPGQLQGPSIWLRCVIERALPEVNVPDGLVPVIYLPQISRQTLRNVEECPSALAPLVELQYRGTVWCQRNGKDWTVEAFLVSEDADLRLDVAKDLGTRRAMLGSLSQLAVTPLVRIRGKRLEAEDFDKLMIEDTPRDLLIWLNDPRAAREKMDEGKWAAFRSRCRAEYGFDPHSDGELAGGERLGQREGAWVGVWQRFAESPALYPGIPDLLRRAKPSGLPFVKETWPDQNDDAEVAARKSLLELQDVNSSQARTKVDELESEHGPRRKWVWARLGQSPLAGALEHLSGLAKHTAAGLGGDSPNAMADLYARAAYLADDCLLRALAGVKSAEDFRAVVAAARALYLPWVQDAAEHLQKLIVSSPLPSAGSSYNAQIQAAPGTCILFADGLRFDLAQRMIPMAEDRDLRTEHTLRWAAVPTVTATAKPAVTPVAQQITGHRLQESFQPDVLDGNSSLTSDRLRRMIVAAGYQWLTPAETGKPQDAGARAWTEYGEFDKLGHSLQAKLAARVEDQLSLLMDRIHSLLIAGWKSVQVVTDHGWLLVPGGLPTIDLPRYLTESRWARCATVKPGAQVSIPTAGWYWNPQEFFAFGTGVRCFGGGNEYAHGGISLQECLIQDLAFGLDEESPAVSAIVVEVQWLGMRCRLTVESAGAAVTADLRRKVNEPASSIAAPKTVDADGKVGLLVEDDSLHGATVSIVLLDSSGRVVSKMPTTVGGEE